MGAGAFSRMIRASSERVVGRHGGSSTLRTTLSCASLASSGLFTETLMSRRSARSASLSPAPKSRGHGRCYSPRRFASRHVPTAAEELAQHSQVLEPSVIKRFDGLMRHLKRNTDKQDFEKQVLASPPDVLVPEEYDEVLRGEFSRHCSFGERLNTELMHSGKWVKMLKELGFVPGPGKAKGPCLSSLAVADIIFQRVLHDTDYGGKRLTYDFFCKALCLVAVNMYPNMDWEAAMGELLQRIATAAEEFQEQSAANEPADFSLDPNVLLVLDHFKPKLRGFLSDWSLAPSSNSLQEVLERRTAPRSYERVVLCAEVQAALLAKHGRLCKEESGYTEDKELFDDQWRETLQLTVGMPCLVPGSGQLAAYLGEEIDPAERCKEPRIRLRVIGSHGHSPAAEAEDKEQSYERRQVLPLPTAPASVGDWVLPVLPLASSEQRPRPTEWLGRPGLCLEALPEPGPSGPSGPGTFRFLVAFPQDSNAEVPPEISCMDQQELVALPAKHSDWLTPVEEPQAIGADEAEEEEDSSKSSKSCTLESEDSESEERHDLFGSFARRQLPSPMDARTGTGTTRLKERSIWKHTQDTVFASRASSCMLGGTLREDDLPENQDDSMSPGLPAVKEVFEEHTEGTGAPESRPEQDSLDPNPEASLPHQVASPERGSPERRRRPQLPSGALSGSGFLSPKSGSASGQSLLAWAEQKGLCSPVSPDSRRSTTSSRAGKWSPAATDPYTYACGSPTMRNRRSFMSLEQLFALCKELKIMPDLMSRQAVVRIFKRAQCAGSASAHGGSNFGYLSQEDDKELPPAKLVTSDEVLPARSSSVAQELTIGARPAKEECFTFSVDVVRSPGTSFGVDISAAGKVCMVNAVQAGSLENRIRQYDRLMAFNGDRPSKGKEMLEKLRDASGPVTITVQRPVVQQVIVSKNGKELGLGVIDGQSFLLVTRIAEGAVNDHNLAAASDQVIKVPSRIVTVDGKKGSGAELLKLMENARSSFTAFVDAMGRIAIQAYTEEPYCDEYPEPHEKILAFLSDRLPGQIRTMRESFRYGCSGRGPAVSPGYIGRR
eukprot:s2025_g16.t2